MRYAVVLDDEVVNVVLWDGEGEYTPLSGGEAVLVESDSPVGIGWTRVDGEWVMPDWMLPEPAPEV